MSGAVVPLRFAPEIPGKVNPSSLAVLEECAGSGALQSVRETAERMERGHMIHDFADHVLKCPPREVIDKLLATFPPEIAKTCQRINRAALLRIAVGGRDPEAEGRPKTEVLRETRLRGDLPLLRWKADAIHITADGSTLVVTDWKTGDGFIESGEDSLQVAAYGVAAVEGLTEEQRAKLETVLLQTVAIRSSGALLPIPYAMDLEAVKDARARLVTILERVLWNRRDVAQGKPPLLTVGAHCGRCRSLPFCPAQRATAELLTTTDTEAVALAERLLTRLQPEVLGAIYQRVRAFEVAVDRVKAAIVEQVRASGGAVPTREGWELRIIPVKRETINPMIAMSELLAEVEAVEAGKAFEVSKAGIARALDGDAEKVEGVLARIRYRGGISENASEMVREVKRR